MAAAARSVYFVPGGRGGRRGILCNAVVVVVVVRGWRFFMLFWSRFFFEEETTAEVGEVGTWLAKPVQRNDHGVCGIRRPVRKRGERERERRGEERREFFFFSRVNWSVSIGICCGILRASVRFFRFVCGGDRVEADKVHGGVRRGGGGW